MMALSVIKSNAGNATVYMPRDSNVLHAIGLAYCKCIRRRLTEWERWI